MYVTDSALLGLFVITRKLQFRAAIQKQALLEAI
jgi:hypothetical protein